MLPPMHIAPLPRRLPGLLASALGAASAMVAPAACTPEVDDGPAPDVVAPTPGFVVSIPVPVRTLNDVAVVAAAAAGVSAAWAVGTDGAVLHYDGKRWVAEPSGVDVDLESVFGIVDPDGDPFVVAVGAGGTLIQRSGGGDWSVVPTAVDEALYGVWVKAIDDIWAVGDNGRVLRYDGVTVEALVDEVLIPTGANDEDGKPIAFPIPEPLKGVMGREDEVFVVGPRGSAYRFDGTIFTREATSTNRPLSDIFTEASIWATATDGVILRRRGGNWVTQSGEREYITPVPAYLQGVWARNDDDVFAVGLTPEVFHFTGGAWTSTLIDDSVDMRAIDGAELPLPEGAPAEAVVQTEVFAVGAGGRIVRGPAVLPRADETSLTTVAVVEEQE
jgi:hypothetical protein